MLVIPQNIETKGVPTIPATVGQRMHRYLQARSALFLDWSGDGSEMLITTRFAQTQQLHLLQNPGGARRQLTFAREPVVWGKFCPNPNHHGFLFLEDQGGGEWHQIYYHDLLSQRQQMLSDGESKNGCPLWANGSTMFAYNSTRRNNCDHDIYLADIDSDGKSQMLYQAEGFWQPLCWSPDNNWLLLFEAISATRNHYHLFDMCQRQLEPLTFSADDEGAHGDALWSSDGRGLYFIADLAGEFRQLHYYDLADRRCHCLTSDIPWDISAMSLSRDGECLAFVANEDGWDRIYLLATATRQYRPIDAVPLGVISALQFDPSGDSLAFSIETTQSPADIYTWKRRAQRLIRWTWSETGPIATNKFVSPELIHYRSFDGRFIPAFYYRPPAKFVPPYPVIIHIHGGPAGQSRPDFYPSLQYWLIEMGIAVLVPNVRGSRGYGKTYLQLDDGYQREDSVKDIGSLLDWLGNQDELAPDQVVVHGRSYGGYMVLASLCHFGDRLRAGIEMVGISNFVTFLEKTKLYRRDLRRVEYGDERDPQMRSFLQSISPANNANQITRPLLVTQGFNDPRVPADESEQIVAAVQQNGQEVWYILARDEGHGFQKQENIEYHNSAVAYFLEKFLPGNTSAVELTEQQAHCNR